MDGCDISADMLHHCRAQAEQEGLTPVLYNQATHALDLPQTYRTIFICDSFGIGGQREQDLEGLRRIHRHLTPGGALAFSHDLPHGVNAKDWMNWLPEQRAKFPEEWSETGTRKQAANGDEIELIGRVFDLDPVEQCLTVQMRANLWQNGVKVAQEEHTIAMILYFYHELRLLLTLTGFEKVEVRWGYADNTDNNENSVPTRIIFTAQKSDSETELLPHMKKFHISETKHIVPS